MSMKRAECDIVNRFARFLQEAADEQKVEIPRGASFVRLQRQVLKRAMDRFDDDQQGEVIRALESMRMHFEDVSRDMMVPLEGHGRIELTASATLSSRSEPSAEKRNRAVKGERVPPLRIANLWIILGFAFPKSIRTRVYDPIHNELLEDYYETRQYKSGGARIWLVVCFTFRTILLLLECCRAVLADKAGRMLLVLMPESLREWWRTNGG